MNEDKLKTFGGCIQRVINKEQLSREETRSLFREILENKQPDLQQGAFLAALVSKGETAQEIAGAWEAINTYDTLPVTVRNCGLLVENSGTGMDSLKTFNVSSAAGIVAAACGATLARHGARALTSFCGTVDILERVGIDVECDVQTVARSIESVGIGLFNGMSPQVHPAALGRILSQIRFGSTLNIAASLANPARPGAGLRGVYAEALIPLVAQVMREIGYQKGMVVHGRDDHSDGGMDEMSVTGETIIRNFAGEQMADLRMRPEDVGLPTAHFEEIAATNDFQKESRRFIQVLAGQGHEACVNFTCLNAGAILVVAGVVKNLRDGITMSREAILSGTAVRKLRDWIAVQNRDPESGLEKMSRVLRLAEVNIN